MNLSFKMILKDEISGSSVLKSHCVSKIIKLRYYLYWRDTLLAGGEGGG